MVLIFFPSMLGLLGVHLGNGLGGVVAAVEEGAIPESRIDESAARVLALKEKRGLI